MKSYLWLCLTIMLVTLWGLTISSGLKYDHRSRPELILAHGALRVGWCARPLFRQGWATGSARGFQINWFPVIYERRVIGREGPGQDFNEPITYVWIPLWPVPVFSGAMTLRRYRRERRALRVTDTTT